MSKRLHFILIFFLFSVICSFSQENGNNDRLRKIVSDNGSAEIIMTLPEGKSFEHLTRNFSILSVTGKSVIVSLSPITLEAFLLLNTDYTIIERSDTKGLVTAAGMAKALEWESYPTYTQYDSILQSFQSLYPTLCNVDTIGTSINGKLVLVLKLSDNVLVDEDEPEVFYSSTIHGDETGGFILMLRLADYLLKNYTTDMRVRNLMDNLEIWINPLANPDGTYKTGNVISSPTRYNANGYDLNRNFPDPLNPNSIKQKETLDMMKFMRERRFVLSANFHAGVEVVNYPWDRWLSKFHADDSWFNSISRAYADTAHVYGGAYYMNDYDDGVTRGAEWYVIYGGRQDYITWELQGREVTIELDYDYVTPAAQLALLWNNNWHSLIGYLENALYGIHGYVRSTVSQLPVPSKIFISGHDKDSSHIYSDTLTGSFVRLLDPGSWNITFSSEGYYDTTITAVEVYHGQKTDLIVDMAPTVNMIDTTVPESPVLYPNPAHNEIYVILPNAYSGEVNVKIVDSSGRTIRNYMSEIYFDLPMIIDLRGISAGSYTALFSTTATRVVYKSRFVVVN